MTKNIISGVFFNLDAVEQVVREKSMKWRVAVLLSALFAIVVLGSLISLATISHSGLGIQIIVATFAIGITTFIGRRLQIYLVGANRISPRNGLLLFIGISVLSILIALGLGAILVPAYLSDLPVALIVGGIIIAAYIFLIVEIYPMLSDRGAPGLITITGLIIVFALVYMTAVAKFIVPYDPFTLNVGPVLSPPSPGFPLGTTSLGQDLLSRTISGGNIMLQVAVISVVVCFSIGVPAGLIASYYGGALDRTVSLVMDSIFALPGLVLAIAIAAMLGPGVINMAIAIAVIYIPSYFRVVRSQVLTVKELPYVEAAIVLGARHRDIIFRYILPNVFPSAVVVMSINFADAVLTAAGLTFVGLGLPIDVPDWGWDLTFGWQQLQVGAWWVISFPGLMIVLLALGFTLAGEGLNELLTPKLQE
ncbi:MAG: ABC transporter permease [Candidatus Thorarchaeota archaeon]